jgi:hypothetical protein
MYIFWGVFNLIILNWQTAFMTELHLRFIIVNFITVTSHVYILILYNSNGNHCVM